MAIAFGVAMGLYEITRTLPLAGGVPQYRAKNLGDSRERANLEPSLRPAAECRQSENTAASIKAESALAGC